MHRVGEQPIPGYKLEQFLGSGSYGEVWRAAGPGGVGCAMKFIRLDSNSGFKEFRSIGLVKKVRHPNLVPINAVWLQDPEGNLMGDSETTSVAIRMGGTKTLIIAMGLGDKTLGDRLRESPTGIPVGELVRYLDDAARGIDYLNKPVHDLGDGKSPIIHCDIKPANLLLVADGVQVCDYGVAKALRKESAKKTQGAGGTPAYAAPELLNNDPSPHTDQFSLAITYFELRTGRLPFDENRAMAAILLGQLDLTALPAAEREVIKRATHHQPAKRFPSCRDMVEALWQATGLRSAVIRAPQERAGGPAPPPSAQDLGFDLPPLQPEEGPEAPTVAIDGPPLPPAGRLTDRLRVGVELVPSYTLVRPLGQGGYGQVWEAESGGLSYALKIVRDIGGKGRNEFEVLKKVGKLRHENLVEFRGFWLLARDGSRVSPDRVGQPGVPDPVAVVIATNLADKNLLQRLQDCQQQGLSGIPPRELVGYIQDAAFALDFLNKKHNVQHRDVKPENLLLNDGRVQVSDFGLAKLLEGDGWAAQSANSGLTLEYAAPELLSEKKVYPQTDQYSLALTYYTLRTGTLPYPSNAGPAGTMDARIRGQLDLSGVGPGEQLVLRRALNPRPTDRFSTCDELARKLAEALDGPGRKTPPLDPRPSSRQTPQMDMRGTMVPGFGSVPTPWPDEPEPVVPLVKSEPMVPADTWPARAVVETPRTPDKQRTGTRTDKPRDTDAPEGSFREGPVGLAAPRVVRRKNKAAALAAVGVGAAMLIAVAGVVVYLAVQPPNGQEVVTAPTKNGEKENGGDSDKQNSDGTRPTDKGVITVPTNTGQGSSSNGAGGKGDGSDGPGSKGQPPPPDDKKQKEVLADARSKFAELKVDEGLTVLNDLRDEPTGAIWNEANAVRTAWERARDEKYDLSDPRTPAQYVVALRSESDKRLKNEDWDALEDYARLQLALKVQAALASPQAGVKWWERLADACVAANELRAAGHIDQKEWVRAGMNECWAELTLARSTRDLRDLPLQSVRTNDLGGYAWYANTLRKLVAASADDVKDAAEAVAQLVPAEAGTVPAWGQTGYRLGRLSEQLFATSKKFRTADGVNLAEPYKPEEATRVIGWLAKAEAAARRAKGVPVPDPAELRYERALAVYVKHRRDKTTLGKAVGEVETAFLEKLEKTNRPARGRFWVIDAASQTDWKAELDHLEKAFELLSNPDSTPAAQFAYDEVIWKVRDYTDQAIEAPTADPDKLKMLAKLLAKMGRGMCANDPTWSKCKIPVGTTPAQESIELRAIASEAACRADDLTAAEEYYNEAKATFDKANEPIRDSVRHRLAAAAGTIGWRRFDTGYEAKSLDKRKTEWAAAQPYLTQAVAVGHDIPRERSWRWRFGLGLIRAGGLPEIRKRGATALASEAFQAASLIREIEPLVIAAYSSTDPVEKKVADRFYLVRDGKVERTEVYKACRTALQKGIADEPDSAAVPVWRLMDAELDYALQDRDRATMTAEEKAKLLKVVQSFDRLKSKAEAAVQRLDKNSELKIATKEMIVRIEYIQKVNAGQ